MFKVVATFEGVRGSVFVPVTSPFHLVYWPGEKTVPIEGPIFAWETLRRAQSFADDLDRAFRPEIWTCEGEVALYCKSELNPSLVAGLGPVPGDAVLLKTCTLVERAGY